MCMRDGGQRLPPLSLFLPYDMVLQIDIYDHLDHGSDVAFPCPTLPGLTVGRYAALYAYNMPLHVDIYTSEATESIHFSIQ